jgi:2-C-methyl-D-erythritol 4-phosphate cytidylyltransferase
MKEGSPMATAIHIQQEGGPCMSATTPDPAGRVVAVVLCAGQGTRMGAAHNKVFLPLAGRPLFLHSVATLHNMPEIDALVLVAHPREVAQCRDLVAAHLAVTKPLSIIVGGSTRHGSEYQALNHLRDTITAGAVALVLIHDSARPLLTADDARRLLAAARATGGALLAAPVSAGERIVRAAEGLIAAELPAEALWRAQTPQAFRADLLLAAYDQAQAAGFDGTDTAASFERAGYAVRVVAGPGTNVKVTTPDDLALAEYLLRQRGQVS